MVIGVVFAERIRAIPPVVTTAVSLFPLYGSRAIAGQVIEVDELTFIVIPPGTFTAGSAVDQPGHRDNEIEREVDLFRPFAMLCTEVTWEQYWKFIDPTKIVDPHLRKLPAAVSYQDAVAFTAAVRRQTGRRVKLPTEDEWEYCARAGCSELFPVFHGHLGQAVAAYRNGDRHILAQAARRSFHFDSSCAEEVAQFEANNFGLYDTSGNLWEWCEPGPDTPFNQCPIRGGGWSSVDCLDCRPARRSFSPVDEQLDAVGFRLVLEL